MKWIAWLGGVFVASGCLFAPDIPAGAKIECASDDQCPQTQRCQTTLARCVPISAEAVPPSILEVAIEPSAGRDGDEVVVTFETDEPLLLLPDVVLNDPSGPVIVGGESLDDTLTVFRFTQLISAAVHTEGTHLLTASLVDRAGNPRVGETLGAVTFDYSAPTIVEAGTRISPAVVRPGASVSVIVSANEPVRETLRLRAGEGAALVTLEPVTVAESTATFIVDIPPNAVPGEIALVAIEVEDLVGNRAPGPFVVGSFTVDADAPAITGATLASTRVSAVAPFNRVEVTFALDDVADVAAEVGGEPMICGPVAAAVTCAFTVDGGLPEGPTDVIVRALDAVGNLATEILVVEIDHSPPGVVSAELTLTPDAQNPLAAPLSAKAGTAVAVEVALDEALGAAPTLTAPAINQAYTRTSADLSARQSFEQTMSAAASGSYTLELTLVDEVGNAGTVTLAPRLTVDNDPPASPKVDALDAIVLHRVPWGATATGGAARTSLTGGPGAVTDGLLLRAFVPGGGELGRSSVLPDGSFAEIELGAADRAAIEVQAVDEAGNASARVAVRQATWLATLAGRVPGLDSINPHQLRAGDVFEPSLLKSLGVVELAADKVAFRDGATLASAGELAWSPLGSSADAPASAAAMAYDWGADLVVNQRIGISSASETWLWDGFTWQFLFPQDPEGDGEPLGREEHQLAYHDGYASVLLFGGHRFGSPANDLWRFDTVNRSWQQLDGGTGPGPRSAMAMAYDAARRELVIFGGDNAAALNDETWVWHQKGEVWEQRPVAGPSPRRQATMAFDARRDRVVLFGGLGPTAATLGDTWEWDGFTWLEVTPTDAIQDGEPSPSFASTMAFDRRFGRVVMRGGSSLDPQVWSWTGEEWELELDGAGLPAADESLMSENPDGPLVLGDLGTFGFSANGQTFRRTKGALEFDNRRAHAMAFLPLAQTSGVVFGGYGAAGSPTEFGYQNAGSPGETYGWDGALWSTLASGPGSPMWRSSHAMVGDKARSTLVMFGGWLDIDTGTIPFTPILSNETWEWDGAAWSARTPIESPSERMRHMMVYDDDSATVVLLGGEDLDGAILADTWEWLPASNTWTQHQDGPGVRGGDMAWHDSCGCIVLFGGFQDENGFEIRTSETWTWVRGRSPQWLPLDQIADPDNDLNPRARSDHRMAYDEDRDVTVLVGGLVGQTGQGLPVDETWEFELQGQTGNWRRVNASTLGGSLLPRRLHQHSFEYDPVVGEPTLFGGGTKTEMFSLTSAERRPFVTARFDLTALGVVDASVDRLAIDADAGGRGFVDAAAVDGVELMVWRRPGGWETIASSNAGTGAPAGLTADIDRPSFAVFDNSVNIALIPSAGNETSTARAEVVLDYLEVSLEYSLPAQ